MEEKRDVLRAVTKRSLQRATWGPILAVLLGKARPGHGLSLLSRFLFCKLQRGALSAQVTVGVS